MMNFVRTRLSPIFILLLVSLLVTGCARNPVSGERELVLISENQEIAYGREAHPEIVAQLGTADDPTLQNYLSSVGQQMARNSHRPDLPWHFTVVDDPVINAFALPGGYIYFTRGILAYMKNEAEMAGVLGHEIAHVTARHAVSRISKAQLFSLGFGLGSIFSPTFRQLSQAAEFGVSLLFLKYSRDDEEEADRVGVRYMFQSGYDPTALSEFFHVFQAMRSEGGQALPGWLSSHPSPPDRIEDTNSQAEQLMAQNPSRNLEVNSSEFLQKIDGLIFGQNPREGFAENGRFYHPDLRFQLDYPSGWDVRNSKTAVVFVDPKQSAAVQLTLAPSRSAGPQGRAQEIARQPGIEMVEGQSARIHGNSAYLAVYRFQDPSGVSMRALAAFVGYGDHLYQIAGMTPSARYRSVSSLLQKTVTSFRALRDERILSVQPDRIRVIRSDRGDTLQSLAREHRNPRVDLEELSLLNRTPAQQTLRPGTLVKVVEAGRR